MSNGVAVDRFLGIQLTRQQGILLLPFRLANFTLMEDPLERVLLHEVATRLCCFVFSLYMRQYVSLDLFQRSKDLFQDMNYKIK